jgi:hypothetical protein
MKTQRFQDIREQEPRSWLLTRDVAMRFPSSAHARPRGAKGGNMKKKLDEAYGQMRAEYDFRGGIRGKYADRYTEGTNVVLLDPDVADVHHDGTYDDG